MRVGLPKHVLVVAGLAWVACASLGGCGAIIGIEKTTTVEDEGGVSIPDRDESDSGPFIQPQPDPDPAPVGADGGDAEVPPPDAGMPCPPVTASVFNATPPGVSDDVCDLSNVFGAGVAGLGIGGAGVFTVPDKATNVTACIGVDYKGLVPTNVIVRLWSVAKACNYGCYGTGGCIDTATARFFAGTSKDTSTWTLIGTTSLPGNNKAYKVTLPIPAGRSFFFVCRNANGSQHDDIAIDSITPSCM